MCPILVEADGKVSRSELFAPPHEPPEQITLKIREMGWKPYRARFDAAQTAWIVSAIDWHTPVRRAGR
jgi:hypothetical protein